MLKISIFIARFLMKAHLILGFQYTLEPTHDGRKSRITEVIIYTKSR